jgi:hypothetical protein
MNAFGHAQLAVVLSISSAASWQANVRSCSQRKEGRDQWKAKERQQQDGEKFTQ